MKYSVENIGDTKTLSTLLRYRNDGGRKLLTKIAKGLFIFYFFYQQNHNVHHLQEGGRGQQKATDRG